MNNKGELQIGVMGLIVITTVAGYMAIAWDSHEKTTLKLKALDKGCTTEQIEKLTHN